MCARARAGEKATKRQSVSVRERESETERRQVAAATSAQRQLVRAGHARRHTTHPTSITRYLDISIYTHHHHLARRRARARARAPLLLPPSTNTPSHQTQNYTPTPQNDDLTARSAPPPQQHSPSQLARACCAVGKGEAKRARLLAKPRGRQRRRCAARRSLGGVLEKIGAFAFFCLLLLVATVCFFLFMLAVGAAPAAAMLRAARGGAFVRVRRQRGNNHTHTGARARCACVLLLRALFPNCASHTSLPLCCAPPPPTPKKHKKAAFWVGVSCLVFSCAFSTSVSAPPGRAPEKHWKLGL